MKINRIDPHRIIEVVSTEKVNLFVKLLYDYVSVVSCNPTTWCSFCFMHNFCFIGASCRTRVTKQLSKKFKTLSQAEAAFDTDYFQPIAMEKAGFREDSTPLRTETDDTVDTSHDNSQFHKFVKRYEALSIKIQRQLLEHMYKKLVVDTGGVEFYQFVSEHFFKSSLAAMKTLFDAKKANLILKLSNCFEDPIPRLPLDKMPYGLLDYNIQFFSCSSTVNLQVENHYAAWLETMFSHFGHKWLCLHRGPAWNYEWRNDQETSNVEATSESNSLIQEALKLSSIDLEEFSVEQSSDVGLQDCEISDNFSELINDDILNDVNTSMVNLSLDPNEVLTCSTPVQQSPPQALGADVPPPSCFDHHDMENSVSTLWSSVSSSFQKEIEIGLVSP